MRRARAAHRPAAADDGRARSSPGVGLAMFSRLAPGVSYWSGVLPATLVLGVGVTITVAPLTATVLAAVEDRHAGLASAINNAVARIGGLLAIAVLPAAAGIAVGGKRRRPRQRLRHRDVHRGRAVRARRRGRVVHDPHASCPSARCTRGDVSIPCEPACVELSAREPAPASGYRQGSPLLAPVRCVGERPPGFANGEGPSPCYRRRPLGRSPCGTPRPC